MYRMLALLFLMLFLGCQSAAVKIGATKIAFLPPMLHNHWIAFAGEVEGNWDIYVTKADGTQVKRLTSQRVTEANPCWSPDATKIVYSSAQYGTYDLIIMDRNGKNPFRLTDHLASDTNPSWSPNGNWIAFVSDRLGNPDIWIVRPNGTGLQQITTSPAQDLLPAWSRNSDIIFFTTHRDGQLKSICTTFIPAEKIVLPVPLLTMQLQMWLLTIVT